MPRLQIEQLMLFKWNNTYCYYFFNLKKQMSDQFDIIFLYVRTIILNRRLEHYHQVKLQSVEDIRELYCILQMSLEDYHIRHIWMRKFADSMISCRSATA